MGAPEKNGKRFAARRTYFLSKRAATTITARSKCTRNWQQTTMRRCTGETKRCLKRRCVSRKLAIARLPWRHFTASLNIRGRSGDTKSSGTSRRDSMRRDCWRNSQSGAPPLQFTRNSLPSVERAVARQKSASIAYAWNISSVSSSNEHRIFYCAGACKARQLRHEKHDATEQVAWLLDLVRTCDCIRLVRAGFCRNR